MSLAKMLYDLNHMEELTWCRQRSKDGRMYCIGPAGHEDEDYKHDFVYDTTIVDLFEPPNTIRPQ